MSKRLSPSVVVKLTCNGWLICNGSASETKWTSVVTTPFARRTVELKPLPAKSTSARYA